MSTPSLTYEGTARARTATDGLHYHVAGDGPALILLHGSGPGVSGWSNFAANLGVLAQHFTTYIFDLPGFGASPDMDWVRPYPEHAAEALVRAMDDLSISRACVVGNSMGGWVALVAALSAPERFDRLVLMGPGGLFAEVFGTPTSEGARRLFEYVAAPSREAMARWLDCMVHDPAMITTDLVEERMRMAEAPGAVDRMRGILGSLGNPTSEPPLLMRLHQVTQPTLVIWGRDDRMLPLEGAFFGTRRMPRADLLILSDCGHWAQVERKTDFESAVIDFFAR